jgi:anaerobic selenocysteine-containing dehydrogenase
MARSTTPRPTPQSRSVRTFCRFCHAACPIEVQIDVDASGVERVGSVRGDKLDPIFGEYTCIKGRHLGDQHHHETRLRTSLKRRPDGTFEEIPTGQALDEIAVRLQSVIDTHGPRSVASYCGTATFQNAAAHPVIRAFHKAINSPSFYTSITIDQPAKLITPLRLGTWAAGPPRWSKADVSLVVGANMTVSMFAQPGGPTFINPMAALKAAKARGLQLIVIDPRRTETAALADIHLQVRPGEDPTLLAGMMRVMFDEGLADWEFVQRWAAGVDELRAAVDAFDLDYVAQRSGVPADQIVAAARMFGGVKHGNAMCGTGPNMAPHGSLMEFLVQAMNVIGGRYPREGEEVQCPSGILSLNEKPRVPKAQVNAPRPEMLTAGPEARVRGLRTILGQAPTAALADEILAPGEGRIRALFTVGGNPVLAWPDQMKVVQALTTLELHVALDVQLSATAKLADYVIPSILSLERPDVPTNVDRWFEDPYVMFTSAVISPGPELVDEAGLFIEIARRMDLRLELPGGVLEPTEHVDAESLLERCYPHVRVPWNELRSSVGGSLKPELTMTVLPADPDATGRFQLAPEGIVDELDAVRASVTSYDELEGYDPEVHRYRLASRRLKGVFNSSGREIEKLRAKERTSYAHIHPDDMKELGVADGQLVDITSPKSSLRTVAKAAPDVRRGTVSMAHSWGDLPGETGPIADPFTAGDTTGRLSDCASAYDPITGLPVMSAIPVAVTPV